MRQGEQNSKKNEEIFKMFGKSFAQSLKKLFGVYQLPNEEFFEELSEALIEGDVSAKIAMEIGDLLKKECKVKKISKIEDINEALKNILLSFIKTTELVPDVNAVNVYLVLGVNGVGKTTSIAKMANLYQKTYSMPLVIAAADTFRAAAIEQLQYHGKAIGVRVISHQHGSDPAAVVFDSIEAIKAKGSGLVLIDTAGRLHNKDNLVRELQKIERVASSKVDKIHYKKILVVDTTTGQNSFRQAETFNESIGVDAVILTKYDSTAKGGSAINISKELGLPISFICTGEKYDNISQFSLKDYVESFVEN